MHPIDLLTEMSLRRVSAVIFQTQKGFPRQNLMQDDFKIVPDCLLSVVKQRFSTLLIKSTHFAHPSPTLRRRCKTILRRRYRVRCGIMLNMTEWNAPNWNRVKEEHPKLEWHPTPIQHTLLNSSNHSPSRSNRSNLPKNRKHSSDWRIVCNTGAILLQACL